MMDASPIVILHSDLVPAQSFDEFVGTVSADGTSVRVESRESIGPFAALEWLVPTAVIVYLGKSYFDSFLKEMGKDHYQLLKKGLKSLKTRFLNPSAPEPVVVSPAGKARTDQPYSLVFSILAESSPQRRFKLLLSRNISDEEYAVVVDEFLRFMDAFHRKELDEETATKIAEARVVGSTLLVTFNPMTRQIDPVDPTANRRPMRGN